jgi:hypothetical protein
VSAIIGNPLLLPDEGYNISRSVRLRSSASGNFSRTPASAGNRKKWTWSGWVKRGNLSTNNPILTAYTDANNRDVFQFDTATIQYVNISGGSANANLGTTAVFRDPSAWYHIVLAIDTTDATASNRIKIYVNSVQQTSFVSSTYPSQNADMMTNNNVASYLGREVNGGQFLDGYLTEINFIDGQALTPSSFGETDVLTGVWKPKKYTGTYGTNGFFLNFSDPSAASAAAIGKDYSGNGNNWTPNNISVTSGATYDSMLDVPTLWADGGNGRGNYGVLSPIAGFSGATLSNGNLQLSPSLTTGWQSRAGTMAVSSGKWYAEFSVTSITAGSQGNPIGVGLFPATAEFTAVNQQVGDSNRGYGFYCSDTAGSVPIKRVNGTSTSVGTGTATSTSDVFMVAFDITNGNGWFGKNGTWYAGDPSAGTGASITGIVVADYVLAMSAYRDNTYNNAAAFNFGQRPFSYTPPTGFKALNTQNLPEPVIKKGNQWFDATLWTGTGATQSIVNAGGFQPDLVWAKARSAAESNRLLDSLRGATNVLYSNLTNAETTESLGLTAFNSNGFTLGSGSPNTSTVTYVGWQWKEGATPGFDIVTWAGNSTSGRTIAHSLGVAPNVILTKSRSNPSSWIFGIGGIAGFGVNDYLVVNSTNAKATSSTFYQAYGSSTFTVGVSAADEMNKTGNNYVSYLFAEVAGFSKFGSYTGNGSSDGPFVFTGFRPRWVMIKRTDTAETWTVVDSSRTTINKNSVEFLQPNSSAAEFTDTNSEYDFLANGFKLKDAGSLVNGSGGTYVYAAFAETPFRNSLAR